MGKIARFFRRITTAAVFCTVALTALPQYSSSLLSNKTGSAVSKYDVVIWDTSNSNAFKTTVTSRDTKVIGVVTAASIANNAAGMITQPGAIVKVRVTGLVTRGDYVVTSTTAGAAASGGTTDISGAFGVALETGTSTNIYVYLFSPQLFPSSSAISTGAITSSGAFTGTVNDAATNTVVTLASLFHTSTGTPAAGLGSKLVLGAENSTGTSIGGMELQGYLTTVTAGAEQGAFLMRLMNAGTLMDALAITVAANAVTVGSNQTTVTLWNTVATTVNAFGAATTINMGATSPTATLGAATGTGFWKIHSSRAFNSTTPGTTTGGLHIIPGGTNDHMAAITFGGNNAGAQVTSTTAGIYAWSSAAFGTRLLFATTNAFGTGAITALTIGDTGNATLLGDIAVNGGDLTSTATTFNLLASPTTIAFGAGASTAINVGHASGVAAFACRVRVPSVAASTTEGDVWSDSTQKTISTFTNGISQKLVGCLFTQTADKNVNTSVTETTLLTTGVGTVTLPANFFVAGKSIRVRISGVYGTANPAGTYRFTLYHGAVLIADTGTFTLTNAMTAQGWVLWADITCRTTGASGTVSTHGFAKMHVTGTNALLADFDNLTGTPGTAVVVNTTSALALDVKGTFGTSDAANTITCTNVTVEALN